MRIILTALSSFFTVIVFAQNISTVPFTIKGEVNFPDYDKSGRPVYFVYVQNGIQKLDSAVIENNHFTISGTADVAIRAMLQLTRPNATPEPATDPNTFIFYLNSGVLNIKTTGNLSKAQVQGSPMQDEYAAFKKKYVKMDMYLRMIGWRKRGLKEADSVKLNMLNHRADSLQNNKMAGLSVFLNNNINKPYATEAILMYLKANGSSLDIDKVKKYFDQLPNEQKKSPDGQEIEKAIAALPKN